MWRVWRDSLGLVTGSLEGNTRSVSKLNVALLRAALLVVI